MTGRERWATLRADQSQDRGYVAVMTGILLMALMGLAAFAVDVGQWYVVGQQEQRAADAAALAGVTKLPDDLAGAQATAQSFSKINRFENLPSAGTNPTTVTAGLDGGRPTRLRVTVTRTVDNIFGPLLGLPKTTISRTAVADFGGPIPMGSPCNEFGNDPDPDPAIQGASCSGVAGAMWASVASPGDQKQNGDAYQATKCASPAELCTGSNSEYDGRGYFYTVSVKQSGMGPITIQLFDPVFVNVGLTCTSNFGSGTTEAIDAVNGVVSDASTRYKSLVEGPVGDPLRPYCTGDALFGGPVMKTQFTVRHDPSGSKWDPSTFDLYDSANCQKTYPGYNGSLFNVLDQYTSGTTPRSTYNATIADGFRHWTTLCTINNPEKGEYVIQVKTNGLGTDTAAATNHFSIRAYGTDNAALSVSGRGRMSMYSNKPGETNEFYLARVPTGAAGQMFRVRLWDVGDSDTSGKITIVYPPDAVDGPFTGCQGDGPASGPLLGPPECSFPVIYSSGDSDHQGKWQTVSVPIPTNYSCTDSDDTKCWVRLQYDYGAGSKPNDITTWTAGIDGDPVRLVE